jgi:NAD(P)-dependent dehydrogenase (short-subunit alcohol dehydrogenase family)
MFDSLKGKRVLVTGGGTGIGKGIALGFSEAGAAVAVHYSRSSAGAENVVKKIHENGGKATAFKADFNDLSPIKAMCEKVIDFLGGIDILVNNAGITMNKPFEEVVPEQFETLYNVNVRAPFFLTQALLPELEKSRGAVVNISSIHAFEGCQEHSVYAGTRGAIVAFTRELAIELAPRGVRVNAVAPGATEVENHYKVMAGFDPKTVGHGIPSGFMGQPRDISNAVMFIASPEARYIVGQTIIVDGGTTSWMSFDDGFRKPFNGCFGKDYVKGI